MSNNFSKFKTNNSPTTSTSILFGCCDIGETNALLPVIAELFNQNKYNIELITKSPATKIIELQSIFKTTQSISTPSLIITGYSRDSEIEYHLLEQAKNRNIPIILIEDFPGNFIRYKQFFTEINFLPNIICAFDQNGKDQELNTLSIPAQNIIITGQPAYDELITEPTQKLYQEIRNKLNVSPSTKIISYFGTANNLNHETLSFLVKTLTTFTATEFLFANRPHPKDQNIYDNILAPLHKKLLNHDRLTTTELNIISDLVISINSTEGIKSVIRQIPTLQLQLSEVLTKYPKIDLLPTTEIVKHAAIIVHSQFDLTKTISEFFNQKLQIGTNKITLEPATPKIISIINSMLKAD